MANTNLAFDGRAEVVWVDLDSERGYVVGIRFDHETWIDDDGEAHPVNRRGVYPGVRVEYLRRADGC